MESDRHTPGTLTELDWFGAKEVPVYRHYHGRNVPTTFPITILLVCRAVCTHKQSMVRVSKSPLSTITVDVHKST